jgi:putative ABC transport system ATP-binding protein
MNVLTLKNVTYQYEGTRKSVLKDISVEFSGGKIYTIVGKSGAGKSTLLSLISGLDVCSGGEILYMGQNLKELDRDNYRARNIGVIFQSFNLLINATAIENIMLSMNISGNKEKNKKEYAYALLEKVGVDRETAGRKILKLSGGEQQRVGIARALAHNPDIVIADEPTGNLDADTEAAVLNILTSLAHDEGKCVIIVTHSKKVTSIADEVWGINDGKLLFVKQS